MNLCSENKSRPIYMDLTLYKYACVYSSVATLKPKQTKQPTL